MESLLPHAFHQCVIKQPLSPAIIFEGRGVTTYKELNNKANMFCHIINNIDSTTINGKMLIGILSHVNVGSIASLFGILKAGKVYVPIDTLYSSLQLEKVLRETGMTTLIADRAMLEKYYDVLMNSSLKSMVIFGCDGVPKIYALQEGKLIFVDADIQYDPDCLKIGN